MTSPHYDFAILGGDMRQVFLAEELAHHHAKICHYDLSALPDKTKDSDTSVVEAGSLKDACFYSDCILCPIPFIQKGTDLISSESKHPFSSSALLEALHSGQTLFAGGIPDVFLKAAKKKGVSVFDYLKEPSFLVHNSLATAEGTLCEAIIHSPFHLHKSHCAVLGFGNCGHTLASYLKGMFCNVCVCTDLPAESARASVIADSCICTKDLSAHAGTFDFIFNTIPAQILTKDILQHIKPSTLIVDIASAPGGVDIDAAKQFHIPVIQCPGLPGKYAPASSAKFLRNFIESRCPVKALA